MRFCVHLYTCLELRVFEYGRMNRCGSCMPSRRVEGGDWQHGRPTAAPLLAWLEAWVAAERG